MSLLYILQKLHNKFEVYMLKKHAIRENIFLLNYDKKKPVKILFYFPNSKIMHFGDHLFFEPLARELKKLGFDIYVYPVKAMAFYFRKNGFKIADDNIFENVDLIITRVDFISVFKDTNHQILFIDTANSSIKMPLCEDLIKKIFSFLDIQNNNYLTIPSNIEANGENLISVIDKNEKYILFNNYLDSGAFRSGKSHQDLIINFIKKMKGSYGYKVIHTGSKKDKDHDKKDYSFVDLDLRGKTSIEEMFYLCTLKNIVFNVSFDAFQMHLFFINNKKSFIVFRGRYLKTNEKFIKKYVNPPFKYKGSINDLIEYID